MTLDSISRSGMNPMSRAGFWIIVACGSFLLIGLAAVLLLFWPLSSTSEGLSISPALTLDRAPSLNLSAGIDGPTSAGSSNTDITGDVNRYDQVVHALLSSLPGRLSPSQARAMFEELRKSSDAEAIHVLMTSTNEDERMLGFVLRLEGAGWSQEVMRLACEDSSPYLQGEVAHWLLGKQQYDQLRQFAFELSRNLTVERMDGILHLLETNPTKNSCVGLTRLGFGGGLPLLAEELVATNDLFRRQLEMAIQASEDRQTYMNRLLQIVSGVKPDETKVFLKETLATDQNPYMGRRMVLWRRLAALTFRTDKVEAQTLIDSLPVFPGVNKSPTLKFREDYELELRKLETGLLESVSAADRDPVRISALTSGYIGELEMVGYQNSDVRVIGQVIRSINEKATGIPDDVKGELGRLVWLGNRYRTAKEIVE